MVSKIGICLQLIFSAAFAADYYLTYKLNTKNSIELSETYYLSKAMSNHEGEEVFRFVIDTNSTDEKELLSLYKDEVLDNILAFETKIKSNSQNIYGTFYSDQTSLIVTPKLLRIELNEGFAIISIIK